MRFSMSGRIQYFTCLWMAWAPVHKGHTRAVTPEIERRNGRGVLSPDDHYILIVVRMRIVVVVHAPSATLRLEY